jgi:sulfocyanin
LLKTTSFKFSVFSVALFLKMKHLAIFLLLLVALAARAADEHAHDPAAHAGAGLKKELIAGITEADFLKLGDKPKTAKITLVAVWTEENYGMNFNGASHGKATYTIPVGWTVEVVFINPSPVPHSAIVVERDMVKKPQVGEPAFKGAATPNAVTGIAANKASFTFIASEAGDYAFCCGFPTHALAGHWIKLDVSAEAKTPALQIGDAPAREAK